MGRIKKTIIPKPDRATPASKSASVRRFRRELAQGLWLFRKENRLFKKHLIPQLIEDRVHFTPKRKKKHTHSAPLSSARGRKLIEKANNGDGTIRIIPKKTIWHERT